MAIEIVTNHHDRYFKFRYEVPDSVLQNQFDWLDEDNIDCFILYRGIWYHLSEFTGLSPDSIERGSRGWECVCGDSYFSGVLVRVSDDGETYRIGTYYQVSSDV